MQSYYAAAFERDMSCTEAEWLSWLPGAAREHRLTLGAAQAEITIGSGRLALRWQPLPPRQIALMRLPRLGVSFSFDGVADDERQRFMRYFDLYMQRGGG